MTINPSSKVILIVEDDPLSRFAIKSRLDTEGYKTIEAASAKEAIEHLYTGVRPDLILLDLRLPGKGGEQFNTELKGNALFSHIPVVVTSAFVEEALDVSKFEAVFQKPIDIATLLEKISEILHD